MVQGRSPVGMKYDARLNRESAYEILIRRTESIGATETGATRNKAKTEEEKGRGVMGDLLWGASRRQGLVETMAKQAVRTVGNQIGRQILRGVLGGILGMGSRRK